MRNRDLVRILSAAKRCARTRLETRERRQLSEVVVECRISASLAHQAAQVLAQLGSVMGVDPGVFRAEDKIGDLFRVQYGELDSGDTEGWAKIGFKEYVEPFSYDLFYALDQLSDRIKWKTMHRSLDPQPKGEEAWMDLILSMTVARLLDCFAPAVK